MLSTDLNNHKINFPRFCLRFTYVLIMALRQTTRCIGSDILYKRKQLWYFRLCESLARQYLWSVFFFDLSQFCARLPRLIRPPKLAVRLDCGHMLRVNCGNRKSEIGISRRRETS